jgi:hypothetical protein
MRAVAYCRVSTAKQGEGLSLESQRERIAAFIDSQGWGMATYRHDAGTGSKVGPELARSLRELDLGLFDVLVVAPTRPPARPPGGCPTRRSGAWCGSASAACPRRPSPGS